MKASELRIGNWVKVDDLPIEQVTLDMFATLFRAQRTISLFEGVPITEEWLLKFGFVKLNHTYSLGQIRIDWFNKNTMMRIHGQDDNYIQTLIEIENKFQHVHQLQNLYFALTGEELIIK